MNALHNLSHKRVGGRRGYESSRQVEDFHLQTVKIWICFFKSNTTIAPKCAMQCNGVGFNDILRRNISAEPYEARMWLSLRLCHCLCRHNYSSIKYGKYHHFWSDPSAPQCMYDESLKDETQRSCDKMWQHYSTMRILTPKRTLEDRSDRSATLLCTAPCI